MARALQSAPGMLELTSSGLYCPDGGFHVDPWEPVARAVVTHAHGDHLRWGSQAYLVAEPGARVARRRLPEGAVVETLPYGREIAIGGVRVSLHPAGHILGSAQVRIEGAGGVAVVSGDYKTDPDPTCAPFEPVRCDLFVTESTFGLPVFRWPAEAEVFAEIAAWWRGNREAGRPSVLFAYALGKAQRLLAGLLEESAREGSTGVGGPIHCHGAVVGPTDDYRAGGVDLPPLLPVAEADPETDWSRALIVAPPGAGGTAWIRRFRNASTAFASGWMRLRGTRRRRGVERGFVLSDHADWGGLLAAIEATGAERVWVTHDQRAALLGVWSEQGERETFVWNKLITGAFRVGVSRKLVTRALAAASGIDEATIAHRLMGAWHPTPEAYEALFAEDTADADISRPYPFFLAYPLEVDPDVPESVQRMTAELGAIAGWRAEWKWDGIRAQLVRREGLTFLWSRGEDLVTDRFPEIEAAATALPDGTVLDGEVMGWKAGSALPFSALQRRIGRKTLGPKILADVPVVLLAFDLLEEGGEDLRERPLCERRERLEARIGRLPGARGRAGESGGAIGLAPGVPAASWEELAAVRGRAREVLAEGLMLKRLDSAYGVGRRRGPWWKWKIDPFSIDAVLLYAQRGSGRRASLYTDYTFGVWDGEVLVPVAKAYSGLTDEEIRRVDRFVRTHTKERFGPVRSVAPELVFELHFEGIRESPRHKSGIALRFPRMARWREEKRAAEAETLEGVRRLLEVYGG